LKKKWILGLALTSAVLLGGFAGTKQASAASKSLVVSGFGLSEDVFKKDVLSPFEKDNNTTITLEVGNSSDRYTKLLNNKNSGIDVAELAQSNAAQGTDKKLFQTITKKEVPNISQLTDGAKEVFESGEGVPYAVNSIGIVYNKDKVGKEITSWDDLWTSSLKNKIAVPDISTTGGPMMMYIASDHAKGDIAKDKGKAAFKAMKSLKPNVVKTYTQSSDLANMFESGEIEAAVVVDYAAEVIQDADKDVTYTVPASGTYATYDTINVLKTAKNKKTAYKYINYRISKASQKTKALSMNEGPTNSKVTLTDKQQGNLTYGDTAKKAKTIDFSFVNKNLSSWVDQWNKVMNQ
jgi:putative spermidine/putrescine transport system substrate-binding protein